MTTPSTTTLVRGVFAALALAGCGHAHRGAPAPATARQAPPRAVVPLVPVDGNVPPKGFTHLSKDGRFAWDAGYLYDRGDCMPRARVAEGVLADEWLEEMEPRDSAAGQEAAKEMEGGESSFRTCSVSSFDPIANAVDIRCEIEGPEYTSSSHAWVSLKPASTAGTLCIADDARSDSEKAFGTDVRWSSNGERFTFLEEESGWNYRLRTIHVVDLRKGTHTTVDDNEAADRREPPTYAGLLDAVAPTPSPIVAVSVAFDAPTATVFLTRDDGERLALFDDHRWPGDVNEETAESPWSGVTTAFRFRTSVDPRGGEMLSYSDIEKHFVVPGLFNRFVRGEPLPPRPPAQLEVPPRGTR